MPSPARLGALLERRQVPLLLGALAVGAAVGVFAPRAGTAVEPLLEPAIAALLLVTFHGIPLRHLRAALVDGRFLLALLGVNLLLVPVLVWALTRPLLGTPDLLLGALLVLLAPCIDYVVVFTALARGAHEKLLAATPLLMLAQALALPVLIPLLGGGVAPGIVPGPFLRALVLLVLLPLLAAALLQRLATRVDLAPTMVPLMVLVLGTVALSQAPRALGAGASLLLLVPLYVAFAVLAATAGALLARLLRLEAPESRAVALSGATRNSLVVLPLALALPAPLAPAAVVTQTLVELVVLVALVRVLPRLLRR